jgi:hypothetical protein
MYNHLANPLIWFLYTLGIVLRYLILPVPVPFLCCTFLDHPSKFIIYNIHFLNVAAGYPQAAQVWLCLW